MAAETRVAREATFTPNDHFNDDQLAHDISRQSLVQ